MVRHASWGEVDGFLVAFKSAVNLGFYAVRSRTRNIPDLADLGLTEKQVKEIILGLTPKCYHAGPEPDDNDDTEEIWEFGEEIGGIEVYIKLQLKQDPKKRNVKHAIRYAFHRAKFSMSYPLAGDKP